MYLGRYDGTLGGHSALRNPKTFKNIGSTQGGIVREYHYGIWDPNDGTKTVNFYCKALVATLLAYVPMLHLHAASTR